MFSFSLSNQLLYSTLILQKHICVYVFAHLNVCWNSEGFLIKFHRFHSNTPQAFLKLVAINIPPNNSNHILSKFFKFKEF